MRLNQNTITSTQSRAGRNGGLLVGHFLVLTGYSIESVFISYTN